jgi:translation initiation factor IF-1
MVRNVQGGCKTKARAKKDNIVSHSRMIDLPQDEFQFIAYVNKSLGDGRFEITLSNGDSNICILRGKHKGKYRRKFAVTNGTFLLVALREWETPRKFSDLISVYTSSDVETLFKIPNIDMSCFHSLFHSAIGTEDEFMFSNTEKTSDIAPQPITKNIENDEEPVEINGTMSDWIDDI